MAAIPVWAVVPAAGAGQRFSASPTLPGRSRPALRAEGVAPRGEFPPPVHGPGKLLERIGSRSILAALLDALDASRVAGVVVVVNLMIAEAIRAERPATQRRAYVVNDRPASEMIESVQMGLFAAAACGQGDLVDGAPPRADDVKAWPADAGYLVCPGDHPGVSTKTVDACVRAFESSPRRIIIAAHGGRRGHPIILPADLARMVVSWPASERLDRLRERFPDRVSEIDVGDPAVLVDVDTRADLARAGRESLGGHGSL